MKTSKRIHQSKFSIRPFLPGISVLVGVVYVSFVMSCSFYKVNSLDPLTTGSVAEQIKNKEKYIILHEGERQLVWHLLDISIDENDNIIHASVEPLPQSHNYYLTAKEEGRANLFKGKGKGNSPYFEVHIHAAEVIRHEGIRISIPYSKIAKVEVYSRHTGATALGTSLAITSAAVVIAAIIIAAKSSCPFVYTDVDNTYTFTGEIFGGAIYPSLERDDYLPLPAITSSDNHYKLRISNELLEKQFTNLANLIVVDHEIGTKILLDQGGEVQTISDPTPPVQATSAANTFLNQVIQARDSVAYQFDDHITDDENLSSLTLTFERPAKTTSCKLILNAKNSYWLDFVFGKFNEQFGTYYNTFAANQKKEPRDKLIQWGRDENIPLSVFIETDRGWKLIDYINTIGPLASRDLVIPVDLHNVTADQVKIKLQCGFMFWEVDYAAVDFSENVPTKKNVVNPSLAFDEQGRDVAHVLEATDNQYLIQPEIGNVATLEFVVTPPESGNVQSAFLHSRGYYEYIRDYNNIPNPLKLRSFREKGSFTQFAKDQYFELTNTGEVLAAAFTQNDN